MIECTIPEEEPVDDDSMDKDPENQWMMHVDISLNANGSRVGLILTSCERDIIQYTLQFGIPSTNNKVKYKALTTGLRISK